VESLQTGLKEVPAEALPVRRPPFFSTGATAAPLVLHFSRARKEHLMELILLVVVLVLLFGGGGYYWSRRRG